MPLDFPKDKRLLRLSECFSALGAEICRNMDGDADAIERQENGFRQLARIYSEFFPGRSLFASVLNRENDDTVTISDSDKTDIAKRTARAMKPDIDGIRHHVTAETDREISAKAPKRKRRFGHEGNGLKGPKTLMMAKQKAAFFAFLKDHPECKGHSRISRAHELWQMHPEWESAATAVGEAKGYSSHKALAAAK